ncbi:hypothetical protein FA13DRAFT_1798851 [Coprinellus micaceus]|uniref:Uncharacterized protein n=1 Tax=Coprinellus micaceus TaxID=71717 RepID=A0A4Y7SMS2_COPMI|nr:hypothetical protein FA13DRAFT_1798851 [Coprinellus micaceus]
MFGTATTTVTPTSTASSVATDKAVAGYKVMDVYQPTDNIPIRWTTFAPPLPFRITKPLAPNVVRLPCRIFTALRPEDIDLRIAFTDPEVEAAEHTLAIMHTYDEVRKRTGPGGNLFEAAITNNPDSHWADKIKAAEVADHELKKFTKLRDSIMESQPPIHIRRILETSLQERKEIFRSWTNIIEGNIDIIRVAIRHAQLTLRNYDNGIELYGQCRLGRLTAEQRAQRKGAICETCQEHTHWQVDQVKWTCPFCTKTAPHHYANDCPSKPVPKPDPKPKPRRSTRNRRRNQLKKIKEEEMEIDNEWKFETDWDDDRWGDNYH